MVQINTSSLPLTGREIIDSETACTPCADFFLLARGVVLLLFPKIKYLYKYFVHLYIMEAG